MLRSFTVSQIGYFCEHIQTQYLSLIGADPLPDQDSDFFKDMVRFCMARGTNIKPFTIHNHWLDFMLRKNNPLTRTHKYVCSFDSLPLAMQLYYELMLQNIGLLLEFGIDLSDEEVRN